MNLRFSQRIGLKPKTKNIQMDSMDDDLTNSIWNIIQLIIFDSISSFQFDKLRSELWLNFYKKPIDYSPYRADDLESFVREKYFNYKWYEIYEFVEFLIKIVEYPDDKARLIEKLNIVLEREFSGWRVIDNIFAPITNDLEINELKESFEKTKKLTAYQGANIHLSEALNLLSDKKKPDYRNSIKESISAVETVSRKLTNKNSLSRALKELEKKGILINNQLRAGFERIYTYTNDKQTGIRHAIIDQPTSPDFNDAKYMLISCSAFVNYLIGKSKT